MRLNRFRARHFRCLYDPDWINIQDPTVLIGCNDGGKTATIDALSHFFGTLPPPADAYSYVPEAQPDPEGNRQREPDITLEGIFALSPQEVTLLQEILLAPPAQLVRLRKVFQSDGTATLFEMLMNVPDDPEQPADPSSLTITQIRECLTKFGIPSPRGKEKEPLLAALTQWLRQQPMKEEWAPVPNTVIDLLPLYQMVEARDPENTILQMLNVAHRQLLKQPETQELMQRLEGEVDRHLRQPLEAKTASLSEYVHKYLPDIVQAYVTPRFTVNAGLHSAPLTLVGSDNFKIDLSARGAGTRQQVTLAVFEWSSEAIQPPDQDGGGNTLLAFDEPDLHLDYHAQRRIYEAIESYVEKGVQVVLATHSINFINRVDIQNIYHYSKPASISKADIECLIPSAEDPDEIAFFIDRVGEAMGLDNATMFYERCFLAFEGLTEQMALPRLFNFYTGDSLHRKGVRLVNSYNDYGAIVFAKFMHRNRRPVVFLVDEDVTLNKGAKRMLNQSSLEKAGFSISQQVHFVGPQCFEYAFPDEVWARVLNQHEPESQRDWTPEKVASYRKGAKVFLDEMSGLLQEDSKPRIGRMLANAVESKGEIPRAIRDCFDSAIGLANP